MHRLRRVLPALLLLVATAALGLPAAAATPARAVADVAVRVVGVDPALPRAAPSTQRISVTLRVTNNSSRSLSGLVVQLRRDASTTDEQTLVQSLGKQITDVTVAVPEQPQAVPTLAPGASAVVVVRTLPALQSDDGTRGLCLCVTGVYRIDAVVGPADGNGGIDVEARSQIVFPNFLPDEVPLARPVRVGWVWPLIDRPHRLLDPDVFDDESLGQSVSPGGRLYRALKVVSSVDASTAMTLLVDPDLIDELTVMQKGYRVRAGTGTVRGGYTLAAGNWLRLFAAVSADHDVSFTAYADPDVDALTRAGLPTTTSLDPDLARTITALIGRRPSSDLAWPADGRITSRGMDALVDGGASQVLLSDQALPASTPAAQGTPDAVTTFPALTGTAHVAVTSSVLEKSLGTALGSGTDAVVARQQLLGELAVRGAQYPSTTHFAVLVPDRYVDTDTARAVSVIDAISAASWVQGQTVAQATASVQPEARESLVEPPAGDALSIGLTDALTQTRSTIQTVRQTLSSGSAGTLLSPYSPAVSRGESTWWRYHRGDGLDYAQRLRDRAASLQGSVRIVQGDKYALASADAPLYITVENMLSVPVTVVVRAGAAPGERGIHSDDVRQTIAAGSRSQVAVPTRTDRTGRFQLQVQLRTPGGEDYGQPVDLRVTSSAIGGIALTITAVAFGVLLLALAIRLVRRLRRRGRPGGRTSGPVRDPVPAAAQADRPGSPMTGQA